MISCRDEKRCKLQKNSNFFSIIKINSIIGIKSEK